MASDPHADRIRLVIEPGGEEPKIVGGEYDQTSHQRLEDRIDLGRLEDDLDYEFEDEDAPPARRRILPLGLAGLALAGFGAIAWYAYQGVIGGIGDEMIPLIQADATPIKSRPLAPGGLEVPYQDKLVLNDLTPNPDKPLVERLLPPPEVPKPPTIRKEQLAAAPVPKAPTVPSQDTQANAVGAPKGGTALTIEPAAKEPAKVAPTPKAVAVPVPPKAEADIKVPQAPAQATQTAAIPGGYLVQLASLKEKKLVGGEWVRLQKSFPKLLAGKKLVLQKVDLGSRGVFHRLRAGYFPDQKSAAALCQALQAKNQACIVVKL
jgi:SPOR domain